MRNPSEKLRVATVILLPMQVALISASHELREVFSWRSVFHTIGPLIRKTMAPLMLRNLKKGRRASARIALPICEPQNASL